MINHKIKNVVPNLLSFFTGSGGLDLGFESAGFTVLGCLELEAWATSTLRKNFPNRKVIGPPDLSGDIREYTAADILSKLGVGKDDIDIMVGGPPCQPFSQAAAQRFLSTDRRFKRKGFEDEEKGTLLHEYVRLIIELKPRNFVIENVPGLLTIDDGRQLKSALNLLATEAGYSFTELVTTRMENYGVPQFRERLIIWGSRLNTKCTLPPPVLVKNGKMSPGYLSSAQALLSINSSLPNHEPRKHMKSSINRYKKLSFGQREKLGRVDRLNPFLPSKTVIAGGMNGGGRSHLHPFLARTLTVRECARLQTYPDSYIFNGTMSRQFTQVGNSVPPLYAAHLAAHILAIEYDYKVDHTKFQQIISPYLLDSRSIHEAVDRLYEESRQLNADLMYDDISCEEQLNLELIAA